MDKSSKDLMEQLKAWRYQYITRNEHPNKVGIHGPNNHMSPPKKKKKTIICHPRLQGNNENRLARIQPINQGNKLHKKNNTKKNRPKQASKIYIEETDQNNCNSQGVYSLKVLVFETSSSVKQEFFSDFNQVRC